MGFLTDLAAADAWAPSDLLWLHDASAAAGSRSKKTTLADLFGNVPAGISIAPASGFGTGAGGIPFSINPSADNADAVPFRIAAHAYEQDSGNEPDNFAWRWGTNQRADGVAGLPDGVESNFAMVVESSFFTGGIHQGEAYWEVYGGDGEGGEESCRPIFCTWDNADVNGTIGFSVLTGAFSVAAPGSVPSFFKMDSRFGQYGVALSANDKYFEINGATAFGAEPTKGTLRLYGSSDSTKKMKIGYHGGGNAAFFIGGQAPGGSPEQNPTTITIALGGGGSSFFGMRRLTGTDSDTAFGFGIMPAASADNNSVHFAGYLNLAEIAAPGDPASNNGRLYVDDNGDLVAKINHGGTTKTVVVVDWSAAP